VINITKLLSVMFIITTQRKKKERNKETVWSDRLGK